MTMTRNLELPHGYLVAAGLGVGVALAVWLPMCGSYFGTILGNAYLSQQRSKRLEKVSRNRTRRKKKKSRFDKAMNGLLSQGFIKKTTDNKITPTDDLLSTLANGRADNASDLKTSNCSAVERLKKIMAKHGRQKTGGDLAPLTLTKDEEKIAQDIIDPDDIESRFVDIGGLDELKQEIWELVVLPIRKPELFRGASSKLIKKTSGVMLYGKPGCGKTLLAKAIAKESGAVFIPIELSRMLSKWVGESERFVAAAFTLAHKVAPAVIFFDEMDAVFIKNTNESTRRAYLECIKKTFLTNMDGISTTTTGPPVVVFGATNRPQSIDPAILRRMPRSFQVPLPDEHGRAQILEILLQGQAMDASATSILPTLAKGLTEGYSGSDLKELCCTAAMEPIREKFADEAHRAVHGQEAMENSSEENEDVPKQKETDLGKESNSNIGFEQMLTSSVNANEKSPLPATLEIDESMIPFLLGEDEQDLKSSNDGEAKNLQDSSFESKDGVDCDNKKDNEESVTRPISKEDFLVALKKVKKTGQAAEEFGKAESAPSDDVKNSIYS